MLIRIINKYDHDIACALKELLIAAFPHCYSNITNAELEEFFDDEKIAILAEIEGEIIGFIGAVAQYGNTGWELHPLVVKKEYQRQGIGSKLICALEKECLNRGGITIYLGSDDEFDKTSLSNTDLFTNTYAKIDNIKNLDNHPFEFYQKNGYKIVGVFPDVNGIGKPDIWLAKRLIDFEL